MTFRTTAKVRTIRNSIIVVVTFRLHPPLMQNPPNMQNIVAAVSLLTLVPLPNKVHILAHIPKEPTKLMTDKNARTGITRGNATWWNPL